MLLDSNIIIYSIDSKYSIPNFFRQERLFASQISYIEVLGFHNLSVTDKDDLELLLKKMNLIDVSWTIVKKATGIRQMRKISLGDSIIAATALVHRLPLLTANTEDFLWIDGLEIINPLEK